MLDAKPAGIFIKMYS